MRLYLVQHGDAISKDVDPERPLSDQGRADIGRLADWLWRSGLTVTRILHSGKLRAQQTAELLAPLLVDDGVVEEREGLAPNDSPQSLLDTVDDGEVIVAGHMPFVSRAVSLALGVSPDRALVTFKPGSVAALEKSDEGVWQLIAFIRPESI